MSIASCADSLAFISFCPCTSCTCLRSVANSAFSVSYASRFLCASVFASLSCVAAVSYDSCSCEYSRSSWILPSVAACIVDDSRAASATAAWCFCVSASSPSVAAACCSRSSRTASSATRSDCAMRSASAAAASAAARSRCISATSACCVASRARTSSLRRASAAATISSSRRRRASRCSASMRRIASRMRSVSACCSSTRACASSRCCSASTRSWSTTPFCAVMRAITSCCTRVFTERSVASVCARSCAACSCCICRIRSWSSPASTDAAAPPRGGLAVAKGARGDTIAAWWRAGDGATLAARAAGGEGRAARTEGRGSVASWSNMFLMSWIFAAACSICPSVCPSSFTLLSNIVSRLSNSCWLSFSLSRSFVTACCPPPPPLAAADILPAPALSLALALCDVRMGKRNTMKYRYCSFY
eukprot:Rhum_TRINITY_DN7141_c0_g1::Rhum_TRINITY_DN7141_c0_g1_i1::g.21761::m.21761